MGRVRRVRWVRLPPSSATCLRPRFLRNSHALEPECDVRPARARRYRRRARRRRAQPCRGAQALRDARGPRSEAYPRFARHAHPLLGNAAGTRRRPLPAGGSAHRPAKTLALRGRARRARPGNRDRPCGAAGPRGRPAAHRLRRSLPRHRFATDDGRDRGGAGTRPRDQADRPLPDTVGGGRARLPGTRWAPPGRDHRGRSRGNRAVALPPVPSPRPSRAGRAGGRGRDHPDLRDARSRRIALPRGTATDDSPSRRARRAPPCRSSGGRRPAGPGRGGFGRWRAGRGRVRSRGRGHPRRGAGLARRERARPRRRRVHSRARDPAIDGRPARVRGRRHRVVRGAPTPEVRGLRGPPGSGARREPRPAHHRTPPPALSAAASHPRPHLERRPQRGRVLGPSRARGSLGLAGQGPDRPALDAQVSGAAGNGGRAGPERGAGVVEAG